MSTHKAWSAVALAAILALCLTGVVFADGTNEHGGIQNTDGDASPGPGFGGKTSTSVGPRGTTTTTESNTDSQIDNYVNQDEQINIDGNKDAVVKVLRCNEKILVNDFIIRTFQIKNMDPIELRNAFREVTKLEGGRAEVIRDKKTKTFWLWIAAPKFQMPFIEAAIKQLDVAWVKDEIDGSADAMYKAKFRDIANLNAIASVIALAGGQNTAAIDTDRNLAMFTGEPYRAMCYAEAAASADKPLPEVQVEAIVYEVESGNQKKIGLDYIAWKNGPAANLFNFVSWRAHSSSTGETQSSIFDPFIAPCRSVIDGTVRQTASGYYMAANFVATAAFLDFLEGVGKARVVNRGKVTVKSAETGSLVLGSPLHYVEASDATAVTAACDSGQPINLQLYRRDLTNQASLIIGFDLEILPYIALEATELNVSLAVTDVVGQTPNGAPWTRSTTVSSSVIAQSGQPICIGGIHRDEEVKSSQGIPVLRSLPVLGWLFGQEASSRAKTQIVVVLLPKVSLGTTQDRELANEEDNTIRKQASRVMDLKLPKTEFGFDQWILDKER